MRKLILILLLFVSAVVNGQTPAGYIKANMRFKWTAGIFDSALHVPQYNGTPSGIRNGAWVGDGAIGIDTTNHRMYIYSGGAWLRLAKYSEVATPTWQQTLTAGSTLTGDNTIDGGLNSIDFDDFNGFAITVRNNSGIEFNGYNGAKRSAISVAGDSIVLKLNNSGNFYIDSLQNVSTQSVLLGGTSSINNRKIGYLNIGTGLSLSSGTLNSVWTASGNDVYNNNSGNVGIGTSTPQATLHVSGSSGTTLRIVDGNQGANKVLVSDADGDASWATIGSIGVPINNLLAATGSNDINNGNNPQAWRWDSLSSNVGLGLYATTTAASSGSDILLEASVDGANADSVRTTISTQISNSHTGTTSTNIGLKAIAINGTNNYAIIVPSGGGSVGIGASTPDSLLTVELGIRGKRGARFDGLPTFSDTTNYKPVVINSSGTLYKATYWPGGGGGTPAGSNKQVQYNNSGSFGGATGVEIGNTNERLTVTSQATSEAALTVKQVGQYVGINIKPSDASTPYSPLLSFSQTINSVGARMGLDGGVFRIEGGFNPYGLQNQEEVAFGSFYSGVSNFRVHTYVADVPASPDDWTIRVRTPKTAAIGQVIDWGAAGQTGDLLQFRKNDNTVLSRFDSVGNLGLGVAPTTKLDVGGTFAARQGADVASANNLAVVANTTEITGTTQVNLIANTGWVNGAEINLLLANGITIKNGQTTSGSNITILLDGAADFVTASASMLTLVLSEVGGTQAWREKSRRSY